MQVIVDESGDLGWTLDQPYRRGGSSRYLTLACMFLPKSKRNEPKDIMRFMYKKFGWRIEKKACDADDKQKILFCQKVVDMLKKNADIKIDTITVKKENVRASIRSDPNKLYNYMCALVIPEYVKNQKEFEFVPDERSIKVKSGNSLVDHLQTKLWLELGYDTVIRSCPARSHESYNLQFIDWIAHCVWRNFEDKSVESYKILKSCIKCRELFFY